MNLGQFFAENGKPEAVRPVFDHSSVHARREEIIAANVLLNIRAKAERMRDDDEDDEGGVKTVSSRKVGHPDNRPNVILGIIAATAAKSVSATEIANYMGWTFGHAYKQLNRFVREGYLARCGEPRNYRYMKGLRDV